MKKLMALTAAVGLLTFVEKAIGQSAPAKPPVFNVVLQMRDSGKFTAAAGQTVVVEVLSSSGAVVQTAVSDVVPAGYTISGMATILGSGTAAQ